MFSINNISHTKFPLAIFLFNHYFAPKIHVFINRKKTCQILIVERNECRIKLELFTAVSKLKLSNEYKYYQISRKKWGKLKGRREI